MTFLRKEQLWHRSLKIIIFLNCIALHCNYLKMLMQLKKILLQKSKKKLCLFLELIFFLFNVKWKVLFCLFWPRQLTFYAGGSRFEITLQVRWNLQFFLIEKFYLKYEKSHLMQKYLLLLRNRFFPNGKPIPIRIYFQWLISSLITFTTLPLSFSV